jgi:hypothetical protein
VENLHRHASLDAQGQAVQFYARERRRSLLGVPDLFRTHQIYGVSSGEIPVASIDTGTAFPERDGTLTFSTLIRITPNGGVHRGLVFCFGDQDGGCALWVDDENIGFHAGKAGVDDGATALYVAGAELPPGLELGLVAAVNVGSGRVRLWGNGREIARGQATGLTFDPAQWSSAGTGSFASAPGGTVVSDVPIRAAQAPDGFEVIRPLSVYVNQVPRHFV